MRLLLLDKMPGVVEKLQASQVPYFFLHMVQCCGSGQCEGRVLDATALYPAAASAAIWWRQLYQSPG